MSAMSSIRVVAEFQSSAITGAAIEAAAAELHLLHPDIAGSKDGTLHLSCVVTASSNDLAVRYLIKRVRATLAALGVDDTTVIVLLVEPDT
ncbi:MAG: hypothetical protein JWN67_831 [Actinomycetia bacterium]|nr:hypothetical protein [Actinomycetes bacterium]